MLILIGGPSGIKHSQIGNWMGTDHNILGYSKNCIVRLNEDESFLRKYNTRDSWEDHWCIRYTAIYFVYPVCYG